MHEPTRIAVCGKGGVGKTTLAALMVRGLVSDPLRQRVLAIDADPAGGLALALGVEVHKTVDDIRRNMVNHVKAGSPSSGPLTLAQIEYELTEALHEKDGFSLLSIGRPEDEGCFCRVNALLKDIIAQMSRSFAAVIIDGEAGVEQINRRVMKAVDHLLIVTDTSAKGAQVVSSLAHLVCDNNAVDCRTMGLVVNRARSDDEAHAIASRTGVNLLGWLPEDAGVREMDFKGEPIWCIDDLSPMVRAAHGIMQTMGLHGNTA